MNEIKENCGLAGIYGHNRAAEILYLCLFSLQHRGQESCGVLVSDGENEFSHRGMGLVSEVFSAEHLRTLKGHYGIGHVRYSTTGSSNIRNVQPFFIQYMGKTFGVAHNGNLTNSYRLKNSLERRGAIFQTTMDSELIIHLMVMSRGKTFRERLLHTLPQLRGAFSLVLFNGSEIIGVRDKFGFRPLVLGKLDGCPILASETCAFDLIGAEYVREVKPGEMVILNENGVESITWGESKRRAHCIFELIYFARPDSYVFGASVYNTRKKLGERLADEFPFTGEVVLPVPDSGNFAALGFAHKKKLPFEIGVIRNHYIGRTFIQPSQKTRDFTVRVKLNPVRSVIEGRDIIVIEDSIVRGTTCRNRVESLRKAGARKIFMGISCPPIISPCYYGIDFPSKTELIAVNKSVPEIRKFLGLDGLYYLSYEGMLSSMPIAPENFCTACFSERYPEKPDTHCGKYLLEKCCDSQDS